MFAAAEIGNHHPARLFYRAQSTASTHVYVHGRAKSRDGGRSSDEARLINIQNILDFFF